jgi:hypothetical protein
MGLSVCDLCNRFLTAKQDKLDSGELKPATFADYHASCARIVGVLGAMGRSRDNLANACRERISDERLRAVADHIHKWLFGAESKPEKPDETGDGMSRCDLRPAYS